MLRDIIVYNKTYNYIKRLLWIIIMHIVMHGYLFGLKFTALIYRYTFLLFYDNSIHFIVKTEAKIITSFPWNH